MNLKEHYVVFPKAFTKKFCEEVIKFGNMQRDSVALIGGQTHINDLSKKEKNNLQKARYSNIAWLDDRWIYKEILPFIKKGNERGGWNFDLDISESIQFTKYNINQHYGWHCDSFLNPFDNPNAPSHYGKIRKLSATISLSDPSSYSGGELEFNFNEPNRSKKQNIRQCKEVLPQGAIVIFPSFVYHRVLPVTKGVRYSLVLWTIGHPYK
jgi:PKHD-type hydroxylase|tara:strand:+ start:2678 stop:3307 length:630 start_codon:yes stop_codon:yes gene_type:complete